jgi:ATP-binding cassette subfamily B protein
MKPQTSFLQNFFKLLKFLDKKDKTNILICVFMMVITSLLEVISIGSLIPFVAIFLSPENLLEIIKVDFIRINESNIGKLQLIFALIFVTSVFFANMFKTYVLFLSIKLSKIISINLSQKIFAKLIDFNYKDLKNINSANVISLVTDKMDSVGSVIFNFLNTCSSIIISFSVLTFLFIVDFQITIICLIVALLVYFFIALLVKKRLENASKILSFSSIKRVQHVKETFGTFKQITLFNSKSLFQNFFFQHDKNYKMAQFKTQFLGTFPRFVIEGVGIVLIVILIYLFHNFLNYQAVFIITLVGALAFAAQRLLPQLNIIYQFYSNLLSNSEFIKDVLDYLNLIQKKDKIKTKTFNEKLNFEKEIITKNVGFKYLDNSEFIFKNLNFKIKKGYNFAITGSTGSGKSTLIDLIMGFLNPSEGSIYLDRNEINYSNLQKYQNLISHVPQEIFLFDNTIAQNISFEFDKKKIDQKKVINSAKLSEIHEFVDNLPNKYETVVGDNGILLSGGQRQRIGLARALYQEKEILTLDEATNALDIETEKKILKNLKEKNITIIQITHRTENLDYYDDVLKL